MNDIRPSPPALLQRVRNWLRSDMLVLRWVFLTLYVVIVGCLFMSFWISDGDRLFLLILGVLTLGCQLLFIFGGGTVHLCQPIRKRRLWMPALVAALMFGVLAGCLFWALGELFYLDSRLQDDTFGVLFWGIVIANWLFWFLLFFLATRRWQRMKVLGRITGALIAGSLAELLAAIPSHMIVSRRPGCFVGIYTMLGIVAGVYVMLFAFGPGIALLFLRPRYRQEQIEGPTQTRWYQFTLRTALLAMLVVSLVSALFGAAIQLARRNRQAAADVHKAQAEIERLGASVVISYRHSPDSLDELFADPGVFYIDGVEGQGQLDDAGLIHLKGLADLRDLNLSGCQVTDAGLIHLKGLTKLHTLNLSGTQVTDAGLIHLKALTNLEQFDLSNTQVTNQGIKRLQQALPTQD